jgi:flagellar operon protein
MANINSNQILYPNVSRIPTAPGSADGSKKTGEAPIQKGEFDQSLEQALLKQPNLKPATSETALNQNGSGIKFSAHATQRLRERNISFNADQMQRMNEALNKADAKGVQDTLVLTDQAALIVSVPNRTVITAMDRNNLTGNVFTNIDGAVII